MTKEQTHCEYINENIDVLKIIISKDDALAHMLYDFIIKRRGDIIREQKKD